MLESLLRNYDGIEILARNFSNVSLTVEKVITMTCLCSFGNNVLKQGREDVESNDSTFLQEIHKTLEK